MQTEHLSCVETNTISKWTNTTFHLNHVTSEYHRVCPKWFLILWYIWCKSCTYLRSRLTLSPNEPKRASTWPTSQSIIRCVQNDLWAYDTFSTNYAPILCQDYQTDQNKLPLDQCQLGLPSGASKKISMPVVHSAQTVLLSCAKMIQTDPNELPLDQRHVVVPTGVSKMISEPITHSAQTMHQSCVDSNTISKWIETGFNLIHVT
jgi:hypothetical protein